MVALRFVKLVFRRLALRKGIAVTATCLIFVGLFCLYYLLPKEDGEAKIRTVHAVC